MLLLPDNIGLDLDDRLPAFTDGLAGLGSMEADQDDLAPGRGLLLALGLSVSIWAILIVGGWCLFA